MSKHTPGPWTFNYVGSHGYCIYAGAPGGRHIGGSYLYKKDGGEANARLMAAAPALLAALVNERRIRLLGQEPNVHWESLRDERRRCYEATDAAIASATSNSEGES
jgi:hypothetical protein